jgi:glycosyltransferase involved in cell wall biosynthesis
MKARSIVQICRTLPWQIRGGMETHAWELAQAWRRRGWQVDVITSSFDERTRTEERDGIPVHYLSHLPRNRNEIPQWRWWNRFARRVDDYAAAHKLDADIVHSESAYGHRLFRRLRRTKSSAARVYTLHGTTLQVYRETGRPRLRQEVGLLHPRALGQWAYTQLQVWREAARQFPSAHRIVAVSDALRDHLEQDYGVNGNRIDVITNGVSPPHRAADRQRLRAQFGLPTDATVLLYLGRIEKNKGIERVWPYLEHDPRSRLVVVGEGSDEPRLRAAAERLKNPASVRFVGGVAEDVKQRMLVAADVLVLPSDAEGQPIVMVEALAAGTPVYASRPWVPKDLQGLVAHDPDPVQGIRAAIERTAAVRARADEIATRYSWDQVARRYEAVFERAGL